MKEKLRIRNFSHARITQANNLIWEFASRGSHINPRDGDLLHLSPATSVKRYPFDIALHAT